MAQDLLVNGSIVTTSRPLPVSLYNQSDGSVIDVNLVNASINVDVTVGDYITVTQSGNHLAISGTVATIGSQLVSNFPSHYPGSVWQGGGDWKVAGSIYTTGSIIINSGSLNATVIGSVAVTNLYQGSIVWQGGSPWRTENNELSQRIINAIDSVTTIQYTDATKTTVGSIITTSATWAGSVRDLYDNTGGSTLVITRSVLS